MGRGRGKGKKLAADHEDPESGEEGLKYIGIRVLTQLIEKDAQKPVKGEIDKDDIEKLEDDDNESKSPGRVSNGASVAENGKKRKRNVQVKDTPVPVKDENGVSTKSNEYRHIGSRRKRESSSSSRSWSQVIGQDMSKSSTKRESYSEALKSLDLFTANRPRLCFENTLLS